MAATSFSRTSTGILWIGTVVVMLLLMASMGVVMRRQDAVSRQLRDQAGRLGRLEAATAPIPAKTVELGYSPDWIALGRIDAPVTVVEFTDYECPYCRDFHQTAFAAIRRQYIDSGKVRWVSRDLPLQVHRYAEKAAEAALCAGEQGRFWELRDALMTTAQELSRDLVRRLAARLALDTRRLFRCVDSDRYHARVANDIADARVLQIDGTPAFVIARSSTDILAGRLIVGTVSFEAFRATMDSVLRK